MFNKNSVNFFDDFFGNNWPWEKYNSLEKSGVVSDVYITREYGINDLSGTLTIYSSLGGYQELSTQPVLPYIRSKKPVLRSRFRLSDPTNIRMIIGFENTFDTDYIGLYGYSTNGDFRVVVKKSGIQVVNQAFPTTIPLDTAWHTMELRLLGTGSGAYLVIDDNEANKVYVSSSDLFTLPMCHFGYSQDYGSARITYIDYWAVSQSRYVY